MTMLARFETTEDFGNRRYSDRRLLKLQVESVLADGPGIDVFIHDLSLTGLLLETWADLAVGTQIEIDLPEAGKTVAHVVWSTGHYFGCQFNSPIPAAALSAAILKNPIALPPRAALKAPAASAPPSGDQAHMLSLGTRMRIIIALATAVWAAIFIAAAVS
jgi:PilZ domain